MSRVIVIGAGAAGLMAAVAASDMGHKVTVIEKNEKAGKKIFITGKGRCNLTNDCDTNDFFDHVARNPKFLYSSIYSFDHDMVKAFFEENGCPVKTERGERVFPVSDHAYDVTGALTSHLRKAHVGIQFNTKVQAILFDKPKQVRGVRLDDGRELPSDAVIVCTGGLSYKSTGSTGDGYRFAKAAGLDVTPTSPSLVPFVIAEKWPEELQGLALKNIEVTITPIQNEEPEKDNCHSGKKAKPVYSGFGEMLFTHFGVSGPLVLTASTMCDFVKYPAGFRLLLDTKPAIPENELENRVKKIFEEAPDRHYVNAIQSLFPSRFGDIIARLSGIDIGRTAKSINSKELGELCRLIKAVPMTISGTRGFDEAVITKGGVSVKEIDPSTMESKSVSGLYFAGEVLDVDAVTGGFNLQIAWSTGHLAGSSIR